jgi:hypothetical protein
MKRDSKIEEKEGMERLLHDTLGLKGLCFEI